MGVIPPDVPLCHKNYKVAKALVDGAKCPSQFPEEIWEKLTEKLAEFQTESEGWYRIEEFFEDLRNTKGEESDGDSTYGISLDSEDDGEGETAESVLDLASVKDREVKELLEKTIGLVSDVETLRQYKKLVEVVISEAVTAGKKATEVGDNYKKMAVTNSSIKDYARIQEKSNHALGVYGLYKAYSEQLSVLKPSKEEPKELYIVLDNSGSMNNNEKKALVNLVFAEARLRKNIKTTVFFFEKDLYDNCVELNEAIPSPSYSGGATDVERSLNTLASRITNKNATFLVVNDGQDSVSNTFVPSRKMVAFTLFTENKGLATAALKSGGKYFKC